MAAADGRLYVVMSQGAGFGYGGIREFDPESSCCPPFFGYPLEDFYLESDIPASRLVEAWGVYFFGVSRDYNRFGRVFAFDPVRASVLPVVDFDGTNGESPEGGVVVTDTHVYGTTAEGGADGVGTVFEFEFATQTLRTVASFNGANGAHPATTPVLIGSTLFGTTLEGGAYGKGTIYKVDVNSGVLTTLVSFNDLSAPHGWQPRGDLLLDGSFLYGTTFGGGDGFGTVFRINHSTGAFTTIHSFDGTAGASPSAGLMRSGSSLFGTTEKGGNSNGGTLFELDPVTSSLTSRVSFPLSSGHYDAKLLASGGFLYGTSSSGVEGEGRMFRYHLGSRTIEKVYTLESPAGRFPNSPYVIEGTLLYGTTREGGDRRGTVFRTDLSAGEQWSSTLFSDFDGSNGAYPLAGLVRSGAYLWGTASEGGSNGCGTVFRVDPATLQITNVASLDAMVHGCEPRGALVPFGSYLYGAASRGGPAGRGTIFRVDPATDMVVGEAAFDETNGWEPNGGLVVLGSHLYGTTFKGNPETPGSSGRGVVFRFDPATSFLEEVARFDCDNGADPQKELVAYGGFLYGTTADSFCREGGGTVFRLDPATGVVETLHDFDAYDYEGGKYPRGGLVAHGSLLFGTLSEGGDPGAGRVFTVDPATGVVAPLLDLDFDAAEPYGVLTPHGAYLYGTAEAGWEGGGAVFSTNRMPFFTTATINRTAGSPATASSLGTLTDAEDAATALSVGFGWIHPDLTVSNLTRSGSTLGATIGAPCGASGGHHLFLFVRDSGFARYEPRLTVNVAANPAPLLGTYGDQSVSSGQVVKITPSSAPSDNGPFTLTVTASAGFTGSLSRNISSGEITVTNPNSGVHTITATANDECGAGTVRTFTLTVTEPFGAPKNVVATAVSASQVNVSWSPVTNASLYRILRNGGEIGTSPVAAYTDAAVSSNREYVYRVRAVAGGITSQESHGDAASTTLFTSDPLAAGMPLLAVHLGEIRAAVNRLRAAAGLSPWSFSDHPVVAGTPVRATHMSELRSAINDVRAAMGVSAASFTDALSPGATLIRALHFQELRNALE